jgi:hypothetical protein
MTSPAPRLDRFRLSRLGPLVLALAAALLLFHQACDQGREGDRCNPNLATGESDCGSGLTCQTPALCPESYCCPMDGQSQSPFCQPGCNGGQASICDAGGDADCQDLVDGG